MSNLKAFTLITTIALFAGPACAQDSGYTATEDAPVEAAVELASGTVTADFIAADLDQDEQLDRDEFVTFAVMRGENGDEGFKDVVLGGDFDAAFNLHDTDMSGDVAMSELVTDEAASEGDDPAEEAPMDPDLTAPELTDLEIEPELN